MQGGRRSGVTGPGRLFALAGPRRLMAWPALAGRWLRLSYRRLALKWRLRRLLPPGARAVLNRLAGAGIEVVLVGGSVRDLLRGEAPKDWDIAARADAAAIQALFPGSRVMGAARSTGTVLVVQEGRPYEVTPYRGATLADDLAERDFTVNAMALGPGRVGRGAHSAWFPAPVGGFRLHDPMGGMADLARGLIRACGDPADRLRADPLRMLRAVRLAAQLGFELDQRLQAAIRAHAPMLASVAPERIGMELGRLLLTDRPAWAMERLRELDLLAQVAPELTETIGVEQNQYHRFPVWEHLLMALALVPPVLHLRLAVLLHDVAKPRTLSTDSAGNRHFYRHELVGAEMAGDLLRRLRFDNETRERAVHLVRYHMDLFADGPISDAAIRRMLRRIGPAHMNDLIQLRRADRLASGMREGDLGPETIDLLRQVERLLQADAALRVTDLAISGADVMAAFGRPGGPWVGEVLRLLLDEVLEEPQRNNREGLLTRLAQLAKL